MPSTRWIWALAGALLAQGAPVGLLILRASLASRWPTPRWAAETVSADPVTFAYLELATFAVFVLMGYLLGAQNDALRAQSRTDPLTGLGNRRHLMQRLSYELARVRRYGGALSIIAIDMDGLKAINDRLGHRAGDAALRTIAWAVSAACRPTDVISRYGGDEFVALLPATDAQHAADLASRILQVLAESSPKGLPVRASIGVADVERAGAPDPDALIAAADAALYTAKARGRNQVVLAPTPDSGA